jgi:outer membrane protein assembly factor BamD
MRSGGGLPMLVLALTLGGSWGCAGLDLAGTTRATLTYTDDARASYEQAMGSFRSRDWEDAKALFTEVKRLFQYSRYARLAELRLADIAFEQEKFTDAIAGYREFVAEHRADKDVEYAKYRIAKALYLDIDDTLLLPPQEERDQATTLEAYKEIRNFLKDYPHTRYRKDLDYMLEVVTGRLARHELYVARYYLRTDVFEATIARADYALKAYPHSGLDPEVLVLKGETLLKMKKRDEARAVFQRVIDVYGGPFATTAQSFLDFMRETDGPTSPEPRPKKP